MTVLAWYPYKVQEPLKKKCQSLEQDVCVNSDEQFKCLPITTALRCNFSNAILPFNPRHDIFLARSFLMACLRMRQTLSFASTPPANPRVMIYKRTSDIIYSK